MSLPELSERAWGYPQDDTRLTRLVLAYRRAAGLRGYPTVWRVRLLLSSRLGDPLRDSRMWLNSAGQAAGLAFLWRRWPGDTYRALERFFDPAIAAEELSVRMLEWAEQRAGEIARTRGVALTLYAGGRESEVDVDPELEQRGFTRLELDPQSYNLCLSRSLAERLPEPALPEGKRIRRLQGAADLPAYQQLYTFAPVDPGHLQTILASEEYSILVVEDQHGALLSYCECSICREEWQLGGEQVGWIDYLETRPGYQKQGLGQAVLLAGLAQLQAWQAEIARLVTVSSNLPAVLLYETTGFSALRLPEAPRYEKRYASRLF